MPIINSVLIQQAFAQLGKHGLFTRGGMYVDPDLKPRWTVEKTAEHFAAALRLKKKHAIEVVMVIEHDCHFYREVDDAHDIHEAWGEMGINDLFVIDTAIWGQMRDNLKLIGRDDDI